jgi:hypothetical protein
MDPSCFLTWRPSCSFIASVNVGLLVERTADPSTALRFGRDDKGEGGASETVYTTFRRNV